MITAMNDRTFLFRGTSAEIKPILKPISNGSVYLETDTKKIYVFDGEALSWTEFVVSYSGGSSGTGGAVIEIPVPTDPTPDSPYTPDDYRNAVEDLVASDDELKDAISTATDSEIADLLADLL